MNMLDNLNLQLKTRQARIAELESDIQLKKAEIKEIEEAKRLYIKYSGDQQQEIQPLQKELGLNVSPLKMLGKSLPEVILEAVTKAGRSGITGGDIKKYIVSNYKFEPKSSILSVTIQRLKKEKKQIRLEGQHWFLTSISPENEAKENPTLAASGSINR